MTALERFLKYVTFETTSNEESKTVPSTATQLVLADYLANELKIIGVTDAERDEFGYVYGHIPASIGAENESSIGFIAHMDTSPDVSGKNVNAKIITFDGTNAPMVSNRYLGKELVVTDRKTLLGADDKAGVAEIVAACEKIINGNIKHGKISVCFTPDEEIGAGADHFDFERFGADFAYTVDGGELGGIEYENFNAASASLVVHGINTHPGSAKNRMKNAVLYLHEFISMLPAAETPAHTENYEGFYHVSDISGNESEAKLHMLIRDHSKEMFEKRKKFVSSVASFLNEKYGEGTFELKITDSYYNMCEIIEQHMEIVNRAKNAMCALGVEVEVTPIRGGTDGARLSFEGLPCPNLSTGGMNYHSIYEAVSVEALSVMTNVLVEIVRVK